MSSLHYDENFEELAAGYFDNVLEDAQLEQFIAMLREDDRRVRRFAELAQLHQMIESEITYHKQAQKFNLNPEPSDSGVASALAELASLYEDNLKPSLSFAAWREEQASRAQAKRRRVFLFRFIIGGACAAVIALATVFAVMLVGGDVPDTTIADQPGESVQPPERAPAAPRIVATLTATHNAQWAEQPAEGASAPGEPASPAPAPGDPLHPGTRLTLTAGFAEITTARGAIAILEAPATVELTDNPNALRLQTGRIVGICETESSQGFVVQTPHSMITDLGTRFGVDVTGDKRTAIHVLEGEVSVQAESSFGRPSPSMSLLEGHAVSCDPATGLSRVVFDPAPFTADMRTAAIRPTFAGTNVVWGDLATGDFGQDLRESAALQVFIEREAMLLQRQVPVDFNREHAWDPLAGIGRYRVGAGEQVDVYLLHYDLIDGHEAPETYVIDFGRPILGVIATQHILDQTDAELGAEQATYPAFEFDEIIPEGLRGMNVRAGDAPTNDYATISEDGTTLTLQLWGGADENARMDQVRVIVRSHRQSDNSAIESGADAPSE